MFITVINRYKTDLGKISISGEVETVKVHGQTTVRVPVHVSSGAGSAAAQVVLPKGEKNRPIEPCTVTDSTNQHALMKRR